jgi:hypothetical protein
MTSFFTEFNTQGIEQWHLKKFRPRRQDFTAGIPRSSWPYWIRVSSTTTKTSAVGMPGIQWWRADDISGNIWLNQSDHRPSCIGASNNGFNY